MHSRQSNRRENLSNEPFRISGCVPGPEAQGLLRENRRIEMRELTLLEIENVSGAVDWQTVAAGATILAVGVAIVATAGLASVPIAIAGAATVGELAVAGAGIAAAAGGGAAIGSGLTK